MKKLIIYGTMFLGALLYADVSQIVNTIKNINGYKPKFKEVKKYNIFQGVCFKNKKVETNISDTYVQTVLQLYAVFQNKANINGKWVKPGDYVEGFRVMKIEPEGVILQKDGKIKILKSKLIVLKVVK